MNSQLYWYIARSSGIVAWALLAGSVIWGLSMSTKLTGGRVRPNWMLDLHRYLGGLAIVFTGVHALGLVLDSYVHIGLAQLLVPMTSEYRPAAVAWGVVAAYLLAAVEITSLMRARISKRAWRATHMLSFPLYAASTAHGLMAGTDATGGALFWAMVTTSGLVLALTVARVDHARHAARRRTAGDDRRAALANLRATTTTT